MPTFLHQPQLPASARNALEGFTQTIHLKDSTRTVGIARWQAPLGDQAVVQLIELAIDPAYRRRGFGSSLLAEVIQQATAYHNRKDLRLRRIWMSLEQKSQVIGRSFATKHGFHHSATIRELLKDQDALIYVRTFD